MSLTFSRRSFLKASALTAVAVAGSGLFTGCSMFDPVNRTLTTVGEMTVLKVTAGLGTYDSKTKGYTLPASIAAGSETVILPLRVTNGRDHPISINEKSMKVTVQHANGKTDAYTYYSDDLVYSGTLFDTNLKTDRTVSGNLTVNLSTPLVKGDVLSLYYYPDLQYNEYSMGWILTVS